MAKDLQDADLKVGLRIRHKAANQVATITNVYDQSGKQLFDLKWDDPAFAAISDSNGFVIGWGSKCYWTIEEDTMVVLSKDNAKVGLTVVNKLTKEIGTLSKLYTVTLSNGTLDVFDVTWADGRKVTSLSNWANWFISEDDGPCENQVSKARVEKPCQACSRMNDIGVSVCWCCGNKPHGA